MSSLNSTLLRTILSQILFMEEDRAENLQYIVPKQGNWFNPKEDISNLKDTWVAYNIKERTSLLRSIPTEEEVDEALYAANWVPELVNIELQFVGPAAEDLAVGVQHWPKRADVAEAFSVVSGVVRDDKIKINCVWFKQEGLNTIYSYNTSFRVYCANVAVSTAQRLTTVVYQ